MRSINSFLRYTGYLNVINSHISRVLLLILVHVQLLSCLLFWLLASVRLKNMSLSVAQQFMKEMVKKLFWSTLNWDGILNKLTSKGFLASGLSTYDFSTLYTTLPSNLIKEKLTKLTKQTFNREGSLYLDCNDKNAFFTFEQPKRYKLWSCQKMCDAIHYLLDNIFDNIWLEII